MLEVSWFDPIFDSQSVFRRILDCMARPGKVDVLPEESSSAPERAEVAIALTLLDGETTFAVLGTNKERLVQYCKMVAGSRIVAPEQADFVFVSGMEAHSEIRRLRRGSLLFPDQGATVICSVEALHNETPLRGLYLRLQGPGIDSEVFLGIEGLVRENLTYLCEANSEFPLGVDTILVSASGQVACLPRSATISWV